MICPLFSDDLLKRSEGQAESVYSSNTLQSKVLIVLFLPKFLTSTCCQVDTLQMDNTLHLVS